MPVDIHSEFIHWELWGTLMRTEYFWFVHHNTSILAKLSTWCFEHSRYISCSLLVNPSSTDPSWEGQNMCLWIYALNLFIEISEEYWWEQNIFCSLLVNPNHADHSWEERNTSLCIYALNLFNEHSGEHWWVQNVFCSFTTP